MTVPTTPAPRKGTLRQRLGLPTPARPAPAAPAVDTTPVWLQRARAGTYIPRGIPGSSAR